MRVIMRIADVQLTFPTILIALLLDGVAQAWLKGSEHHGIRLRGTDFGDRPFVLGAICAHGARIDFGRERTGITCRRPGSSACRRCEFCASYLAERDGPVLVIATINLALAIITEATLSFLGVGLPPTEPSLGTLIRIGQNFLFSGEWWIVAFPSLTLAVLVLAVNLLGDWLRDALNPRLK